MEDNKIYMVVSNFQVEGYGEEHKNERAFSTIDKANEYADELDAAHFDASHPETESLYDSIIKEATDYVDSLDVFSGWTNPYSIKTQKPLWDEAESELNSLYDIETVQYIRNKEGFENFTMEDLMEYYGRSNAFAERIIWLPCTVETYTVY